MRQIVIRSEAEQRMAALRNVVVGVVGVLALGLVLRELPSLVRYIRMELM